MDGFFNLLKPPGMTSSDAVLCVRRLLPRGARVGHGGTLDPDAAGVLPVCVGKATRLFDYMIDKQKTYLAELKLGTTTDTQDSTGRPLETRPVTSTAAEVGSILRRFEGEIDQIPPAFSAIKRDGVRMYERAREGTAQQLDPRRVRVDGVEYLTQTAPDAHRILVRCGKGVYIRTICHDIGAALGCGGHMAFLLRVGAGVFDIERAVSPDELREAQGAGKLGELLYPLDAPLAHLPLARLFPSARAAALNGMPCATVSDIPKGEPLRVYCGDEFAGIGEADGDGKIRFKAMLLERELC